MDTWVLGVRKSELGFGCSQLCRFGFGDVRVMWKVGNRVGYMDLGMFGFGWPMDVGFV